MAQLENGSGNRPVFTLKLLHMTTDNFYRFLANEGYHMVREVPGRGFCGVRRVLHSWALSYGLTNVGDEGRYFYDDYHEAAIDGIHWSGEGDPPGDWVMHFDESGPTPNPNNLDQPIPTT